MAGENGTDEREMLLDRNLASVVRDAPYAVDHLSARSQRPIISRDTCACSDKKRYVSRWKCSWKKLFHRDRGNSGVARYGTGHVTPTITTLADSFPDFHVSGTDKLSCQQFLIII